MIGTGRPDGFGTPGERPCRGAGLWTWRRFRAVVSVIAVAAAGVVGREKRFDFPPPFGYVRRMETFLVSHGYPGLFLLSFLASTVLPVGSEWLLVLMLLGGHEPLSVVAVATAGNYLGACTTWAIGVRGGPFLVRRVLRVGPKAEAAAARFYRRFGVWSLLFSWLPVIGDPLCLAAGVLGVGFARFSVLVFAGKLARYSGVAWLATSGAQIIS